MTEPKNPHKKVDNVKDAAVNAALHLAATQGWEDVTLFDIAKQAGIGLAELYQHFEDKFDVLAALGRKIDRETLSRMSPPDPDLSPRDALFDIFMDRFEVLNEQRDGICAILSSFKCDPKQAVISMPHLCRSISWMLESVQVNTGGIRGAIRVTAMTGLYLKVLRVWLRDDSVDMAPTMAALDKGLARAENLATSFGI
ncbi:MAG: TetR family transcriptional regulator [Micavibrio sp.]|nr:TetR family transcriptional regulator [Micavibrio sp.]|tara:strand:+ start:2246 stop:2839 length:594 start_codon:yes stop_codon:yes gene_type:complete